MRFIEMLDHRDNGHLCGCFDANNGQYIASGTRQDMRQLAILLNNPDIDVANWQPFEYGPLTLLIPLGAKMSSKVQHQLERAVAAIFDAINTSAEERTGENHAE